MKQRSVPLAGLRECHSWEGTTAHNEEQSALLGGQQPLWLQPAASLRSALFHGSFRAPRLRLESICRVQTRQQECWNNTKKQKSVPTEVQKDPQIQWARPKEWSQKPVCGFWNQGACNANHSGRKKLSQFKQGQQQYLMSSRNKVSKHQILQLGLQRQENIRDQYQWSGIWSRR